MVLVESQRRSELAGCCEYIMNYKMSYVAAIRQNTVTAPPLSRRRVSRRRVFRLSRERCEYFPAPRHWESDPRGGAVRRHRCIAARVALDLPDPVSRSSSAPNSRVSIPGTLPSSTTIMSSSQKSSQNADAASDARSRHRAPRSRSLATPLGGEGGRGKEGALHGSRERAGGKK